MEKCCDLCGSIIENQDAPIIKLNYNKSKSTIIMLCHDCRELSFRSHQLTDNILVDDNFMYNNDYEY